MPSLLAVCAGAFAGFAFSLSNDTSELAGGAPDTRRPYGKNRVGVLYTPSLSATLSSMWKLSHD